MIFEATETIHAVPADITVWDFLLSDAAPFPLPQGATTGYTDVITGQRLTFHQTRANSIRLANVLYHQYGVRPGDIVGVCSANSIWYASCALAIMRIGATPAYLSQLYSADEMHHALTISSCRMVFVSEAALPVMSKAGAGAGLSKDTILVMDGAQKGYTSLQELLADKAQEAPTFRIPTGKNNHDYPAALNFSSGTTGLPKAVMLSHQNLIAQYLQVRQLSSADQTIMLAVLPFYHVTGLSKLFLYPIMMNMESVIISKFTMPVLLDTIVKYQMTDLQLVPPIVIRFVRDPIVKQYDLSCVKRFSTGAAPMSDEILTLMEATFPNAGIQQGYGMTESTACITRHPRDVSDYKYARKGGKPVANTLVKIVKEDGTLGGIGEEGEVRAKGPQVCMGYYNNPAATADTFDEEGYLRTGDQGSIDEEGFLTIHDRIKELIKVKGVQVPPAELEDCLLGHPKVEDAGVVGIPDDYSGERPFAFVVVKPEYKGQRDIQHELDAYIKEKKSRPKWLAGMAIVDGIPKSAAGKILRKELKKDVKAYAARIQAKL